MTETSPSVHPTPAGVMSRRFAIRAGACSLLVLVAGGCGDEQPVGGGTTSAAEDRDLRLVTAAIADEEELGTFCTTAARRFRSERPLLLTIAERQRLHVARLRAALTELTPPVSRAHPKAPRRDEDLLPAVGALALGARNARSRDCLTATSGPLAELFASVAAAHAVTVWAADPEGAATTVTFPRSVTSVEPLQPCLAAEHAAIYGYGLLAGVLSAGVSEAPAARSATMSYDIHRARRDALTELVNAAGGRPVVSEPAYDTPFPVAGPPAARRLAQYLEARCAMVYAQATAATTGESRLMVSGVLLDCAVRGARWGAEPTAFPGLDAR